MATSATSTLAALELHSQTSCTLRDINPHAQSGSIHTVRYVTQDDLIADIEEHVVGPACKLSIGIVQSDTQRVFTVLNLAVILIC